MRKFTKGILAGLCAVVGLTAIAVVPAVSAPVDVETAYAETTYTTKDVAMMGRVAGWYGNGNFEIRLTLGECDWGKEKGEKAYANGELKTLLRSFLKKLPLSILTATVDTLASPKSAPAVVMLLRWLLLS